MPEYSNKSKAILATCDVRLQRVFNAVIYVVDCSIISGRRDKDEQNELFRTGKSKAMWPNSYHNVKENAVDDLSNAIDVIPYPVNWNDREQLTLFAGYVIGISRSMGYVITWGGDWDRDFKVNDNEFDDFAHFQIEG